MSFRDCTGRKLSIGTLKGCFASEILMYLSGWRQAVDRLSSLAGSMISAIKEVIPAHSSSMSPKCVEKLAFLKNSKYWNQLNTSIAKRVNKKEASYLHSSVGNSWSRRGIRFWKKLCDRYWFARFSAWF